MFVVGYFILGIAQVLEIVFTFYLFVILGRVIVSWVSIDPYNPIVRFLVAATEPVLYPIRRRLPVLGGIDFSPFILMLAIIFLKSFLIQSLLRIGASLQ